MLAMSSRSARAAHGEDELPHAGGTGRLAGGLAPEAGDAEHGEIAGGVPADELGGERAAGRRLDRQVILALEGVVGGQDQRRCVHDAARGASGAAVDLDDRGAGLLDGVGHLVGDRRSGRHGRQ